MAGFVVVNLLLSFKGKRITEWILMSKLVNFSKFMWVVNNFIKVMFIVHYLFR